MYRRVLRSGTGPAKAYFVSLSLLTGAFAFLPTQAAFQDNLAQLTGESGGIRRHVMVMAPMGRQAPRSPVADNKTADVAARSAPAMVFAQVAVSGPGVDPVITGSIGDADKAGDHALDFDRDRAALADLGDRLLGSRGEKGTEIVAVARSAREFVAGNLYDMKSIITDHGSNEMPRVAFVKTAPLEGMTRLASADGSGDDATGKPMVLDPRLIFAHRAAAVSASLVSAYAPELAGEIHSPFAALLDRPSHGDGTAATKEGGTHDWVKNALPASVKEKKEQACLATAIYFESRGEPVKGQVAVAQVVLNRVKNPTYPDSICKVVYQNKRWRNRCQFSFACDGIRDRVHNMQLWKQAQTLAADVIEGRRWLKEVGASTHYHATYVNPRWAHRMNRKSKIGQHIFYRTKGGGWS